MIRLLLLYTLLIPSALASQQFYISAELEKAYDEIIDLKLESAQVRLDQLKVDERDNLMVYHIENYIDFFSVFISEDRDLFDQLEKNKKKRIAKIKTGDPQSPYYRFAQAEVYLQWVLARSKFYNGKAIPDLTLIKDLNRAYRLLEENDQLFPHFVENKKSLSIIHALASYVPGIVQKLFNVRGSLGGGLREIQELIAAKQQGDFLFQNEAIAIHAYMLLHLHNEPQLAWDALQSAELDPTESPLACFILSSVAMKIGYSDYARSVLKDRPITEDRAVFHYLTYLEGKASLQHIQPDAKRQLQQFTDKFKGRHYIKDAYQKLAWYELVMHENVAGYKSYMHLVETKGVAVLDDDIQALNEAESRLVPHPMLLRARLLYDGGYYREALDYLQQKQIYFEDDGRFKQEFTYRMGRLYHAIEDYDAALRSYKSCLAFDVQRESFFSCNSALQLGLIYEKLEDIDRASYYFDVCRQIRPKSYKDQLHRKAQAGLERISIVNVR